MAKKNSELFRILKDKDSLALIEYISNFNTTDKLSLKTNLEASLVRKILHSLEKNLLIKTQRDSLVLTDMGAQTLRKIQGMEFLYSKIDYFLSHTVDEIPHFLLQRIDDFSNCKIIKSIWPVSTRLLETVKSSKSFVNCIFSEPPFLLGEPLYDRIHSGVKLQLLFGKNSKLPDCNDLVEKLELNKPKSDSLFKKRMCESVATNLLVSDSGACLMLANQNNETDMVYAIVGNDKHFIQWCNDFFEYKWNKGETFARLRTSN